MMFLPALSKESGGETLVFKLIFMEGEKKFEGNLAAIILIVLEPVT